MLEEAERLEGVVVVFVVRSGNGVGSGSGAELLAYRPHWGLRCLSSVWFSLPHAKKLGRNAPLHV